MHDRTAIRRRDAELHRHFRARRRDGQRIARVRVDQVALVEALVKHGLISPRDIEDAAKIDAALAKAVEHWIGTA